MPFFFFPFTINAETLNDHSVFLSKLFLQLIWKGFEDFQDRIEKQTVCMELLTSAIALTHIILWHLTEGALESCIAGKLDA